jgi:hypothetical protein
MGIHDLYARRTPFELAFPDPSRAEDLAQAVRSEARARGIDRHHPHMFATLGAVGALLLELREPDAPPETLHQYALLAFHGVGFVEAGRPLYLLDTGTARALAAADPMRPRGGAAPSFDPPAASGYLQLPQHLFWVEGQAAGEVPESLDGLFWTLGPDGVMHSLLATGLRVERPGLGVIPLPVAPLEDAPTWAAADARAPGEGVDFESSIPGSDLEGLYGVRTAGEALKLLARFFALVSEMPGSVAPRPPHSAKEPGGPSPSSHPFRIVSIDG